MVRIARWSSAANSEINRWLSVVVHPDHCKTTGQSYILAAAFSRSCTRNPQNSPNRSRKSSQSWSRDVVAFVRAGSAQEHRRDREGTKTHNRSDDWRNRKWDGQIFRE